jgi:diguanylate cyclase
VTTPPDRRDSDAAQLREANEHLVVSSLRAQVDAEACATKLRAAELDGLTALPNRALLRDRFEQAIVHARRDGTLVALLFLDLDGFKQINDTRGHAAGDRALTQAARSLVSAIRAGDTVSRHGGDEFLILLAGVSRASDARLVADKMLAALGAAGGSADPVLPLTASIGISIYPDDGDDVDALIARADAAMYVAKRHGPGQIVFHGAASSVSAGAASLLGKTSLEEPPGQQNESEPRTAAFPVSSHRG